MDLRIIGGAAVVGKRILAQSGSNAFDVLVYGSPEFDGNTFEFFALGLQQLFGQQADAIF